MKYYKSDMNMGRAFSEASSVFIIQPKNQTVVLRCYRKISQKLELVVVCAGIYRPEKMKCWALRSLGGLPDPQEPQGLSLPHAETVCVELMLTSCTISRAGPPHSQCQSYRKPEPAKALSVHVWPWCCGPRGGCLWELSFSPADHILSSGLGSPHRLSVFVFA